MIISPLVPGWLREVKETAVFSLPLEKSTAVALIFLTFAADCPIVPSSCTLK
jgi:hypothetical protein